MLTLLSSLISFLMGGLPKVLDFFQDRADKKHEIELARMQTERELQLLQAGYVAQQKIEEIKLDEIQTQTASTEKVSLIDAQKSEMEAIYAHDIAIGQGASQFMINYRTGVRPTITYGFFILLMLVEAGLFFYGWNKGVDFKELANHLWDDETQALFASIIAFHFGGRAFGK
jgi:hypothetical protein